MDLNVSIFPELELISTRTSKSCILKKESLKDEKNIF